MKKNITILLVAFSVFVIVGYQYFKINAIEKENDILCVELMEKSDSVKMYVTKSKELYGRFTALEIQKNSLKHSLDIMRIELKDLKEKNIKWRDLVSVLNLKIQSLGVITTKLKDTIIYVPGKPQRGVQNFDWTNGYLSLAGSIENSIFEGDYIYKTDVEALTTKSGKSYITTVSLSDPNAIVLKGSQIIVVPRNYWYQKWWVHVLAGVAAGIYITK